MYRYQQIGNLNTELRRQKLKLLNFAVREIELTQPQESTFWTKSTVPMSLFLTRIVPLLQVPLYLRRSEARVGWSGPSNRRTLQMPRSMCSAKGTERRLSKDAIHQADG